MSEETQSPEQSLAEQVVNRRAARERIAALGHPLHPNRFPATHLVSDVVERWGGSDAAALEAEPEAARHVAVPGRILAIRKMGKAVFLDLSDGRTRVQAYVRKDGVGDGGWALLENLDLGDHVGVTGVVFRTRTGELSVKADGLVFLAKCLRPLPDKWHGLTDVEIKYRQRYVDLIVSEETRRTFEVRARVVSYLRRFFDARGFLEVETPMMQLIPGGAAARPFVTHHNALDVDLYLRIAPGALPEAARRRGASRRSTRSTGTSGTRGSRPSTTPSSRCSSSTRPTPTRATRWRSPRSSSPAPRGRSSGRHSSRGARRRSPSRRRSGGSR